MSTGDRIRLSITGPQAADSLTYDHFPVRLERADFALVDADGHWEAKLSTFASVTVLDGDRIEITMANGDIVAVAYTEVLELDCRGHHVIVTSADAHDLGVNPVPDTWGLFSMIWQALLRYWVWEEARTSRALADRIAQLMREELRQSATSDDMPFAATTASRIRAGNFHVRVTLNTTLSSADLHVALDEVVEKDAEALGAAGLRAMLRSGVGKGRVLVTSNRPRPA